MEVEGLALLQAGETEQALELLERHAELQPTEYLPAYRAGLCRLRLGNMAEARDWFEAAAGRRNPSIVRLRLEEMMRIWRVSAS